MGVDCEVVETDVAIIGAGPAGTAAAAHLARDGVACCVLERAHFPRFMIGESLLPACMDRLESAGLLDAVADRGYMVKRGVKFLRGPRERGFDLADQFTKGWAYTYQVPRGDFDATLATRVQQLGVDLRFGHAVTRASLSPSPRLTVRGAGGEVEVRARFLLDASGFGRVLSRALGVDVPSPEPDRCALFAHVRGDRRPDGDAAGDTCVCVVDGLPETWIWVIPFADGVTSVGVVARPEVLATIAGTPEQQLRAIVDLEPNARARLSGFEVVREPASMQGYACTVDRLYGDGYCLLGNAGEFIDPIFSSGVSVALESAHRATRLLVRQLRGEAVDWAADYERPMRRGIDTFKAFIHGWYDGRLAELIFSDRQPPSLARQITSILAGYAWDEQNPFVADPTGRLDKLARLAERYQAMRAAAP